MTWLDDCKRLEIPAIATALGLPTGRRSIGCPCGCERRGEADKRLPATHRDGRWLCWACRASGDVVDLVAYSVAKDRYHGQAGVREWFQGQGQVFAERAQVVEPVVYAPRDEVCAVLSSRARNRQVDDWLTRRLGVERANVVRPLVRSLAPDVSLHWARCGGVSWRDGGFWALFPHYDHAGVVRGVRARQVLGLDGAKAVSPAGYSCSGLVLACPLAADMMRTGAWRHGVSRLVVVEGEPDFLAWASLQQHAVIGIGSGWWTPELARRIPLGTEVLIATQPDVAGTLYAGIVQRDLAGRCHVTRWTT